MLNPNSGQDAKISVTFHYGKRRATHAFTVGADRVATVALEDLTQVQEDRGAGGIVRSDVPVVVD